MKKLLFIAPILLFFSCQPEKASHADSIKNSCLVIKTVVAKNSLIENEFGEKADWIEIYNNASHTIDLSKQQWYVSDDTLMLNKFRLREKQIPPHTSIKVWCDDENMVRDQIHTNFKLSSTGETILLSFKDEGDYYIADQLTYTDTQMAVNP